MMTSYLPAVARRWPEAPSLAISTEKPAFSRTAVTRVWTDWSSSMRSSVIVSFLP